jgi:hypothetical protein
MDAGASRLKGERNRINYGPSPMSPIGPSPTRCDVRSLVSIGRKADVMQTSPEDRAQAKPMRTRPRISTSIRSKKLLRWTD